MTAQVIYVLRAIIQIIFGIGTMPTYIKIQENKEVHLLMCKTRVQTNHLSFHVKINRSFRKIKRKRREKRDKLMAETSYLYIFVKSGPIFAAL